MRSFGKSFKESPCHSARRHLKRRSHPVFAVSVVVTVKSDEAGIARLMEALAGQTVKPDEVVVVRAEGKRDKWINRQIDKQINGISLRVVDAGTDCSRGRGRNVGVRRARNEVIAVTDAGCRPHPDWLYKLYKCYKSYKSFKESPCHAARRLLIAGWYRVKARTEMQKVMAHFLVPEEFYEETPCLPARSLLPVLPASRSIMFTKSAWEAVGGYPEEAVSGAEDLEFARRLAAYPDVKMIYCPEALVDWEPPATLTDFFRDIVKHTRGNVEVGYWPHLIKNFTVVLRWMAIGIWPWLGVAYLVWIIGKGIIVIKVIKIIKADSSKETPRLTARSLLFVPIVQLAADAGVIWGVITKITKFSEKRERGVYKGPTLPRQGRTLGTKDGL